MKIAISLVAVVAISYGAWAWWDVSHVRAFCRDLTPGTPIAQIPTAAKKHGVNAHWEPGSPGVFDKSTNDWFLPVWAASTLGDITCRIHHNNVSIVSAVMSGE